MYRRGDPRWNRTIQHIADNFEHANESTQERLWTFTHDYVNPCIGSITQCLNVCTAPCLPLRDDRRRNRGRTRGRAELSFDFYDDWAEDETDGLLGWGNENLDRLIGSGSGYGTVSQPGRQRAMSYGTRNRDARYNAGRRKSAVQPHDGGPDPTIIPSSSYFGFLGRLPFNIGGKGLRYKPSAADLVEHPGQGRRSHEEQMPLIEDSDEDGEGSEGKGHRRKRSHTNASGHTTDSLSSRGDIFPSEDELDDAVPLDDEFTMQLERRTTGQWHDDNSSTRTRPSNKSRGPSGSRVSNASSRRSYESVRKPADDPSKLSTSEAIEESPPSLSSLKAEEERIRLEEEQQIEQKRQQAQQLALKRGLAADPPQEPSKSAPEPSTEPPAPLQPALASPSPDQNPGATFPFPHFNAEHHQEESQTAPDSSAFHVDESDFSSFAPTPIRPRSLHESEGEEVTLEPTPRQNNQEEEFVPAMLPHFHQSDPD